MLRTHLRDWCFLPFVLLSLTAAARAAEPPAADPYAEASHYKFGQPRTATTVRSCS